MIQTRVDGSISFDSNRLTNLCQEWKITELALFGSYASGDSTEKSDIDLLVSFENDVNWDLWDHMDLQEQLESILGQKVDLLTRSSVEESENPLKRASILDRTHPIYVAG